MEAKVYTTTWLTLEGGWAFRGRRTGRRQGWRVTHPSCRKAKGV